MMGVSTACVNRTEMVAHVCVESEWTREHTENPHISLPPEGEILFLFPLHIHKYM